MDMYAKQAEFKNKGIACTALENVYIYIMSCCSSDFCWRVLTADDQVRSQRSLYGIRGGQNGTGTGFCPSSSLLPSQLSFHWWSIFYCHWYYIV